MVSKKVEKLLLKVQKPGRYVGGELNEVIKNKRDVEVRFAFCFPDTYEVGMSHLGMKILYSQFNSVPYIWCERVFAPWVDMEEEMVKNHIPLYALESGDPLSDFDFIGFTLQYELSYTNMLNMLKLGEVPVTTEARGNELKHIVVAGGPCACNPEPIADFVDLFFIGEGEEVDLEVMELFRQCKKEGADKREFLRRCAQIEGVYVPSLYEVAYHEDGTIKSFVPKDGAPAVVHKRLMLDMDKSYYPDNFVVPMVEIVHDRAVQEIFRGCIRGCRFCQAGFIYRPVREKSPDTINAQCRALCENTGYDEVSLSSLSSSDYSQIVPLLEKLTEWSGEEKVSLSLPSLRVDGFTDEIMNKIKTVRKSGLTFAPEAGSQRMRDVINKNVQHDELMQTCATAFAGGWTTVKRLDNRQALFYDRSADRDHGRRGGDRAARTGCGGYLLPHAEPRQGQKRARHGIGVVLCAQALYAVSVGAAGHHFAAARKAGAYQKKHHHQKSTVQLPRRGHELFGGGVCARRPQALPGDGARLRERLSF